MTTPSELPPESEPDPQTAHEELPQDEVMQNRWYSMQALKNVCAIIGGKSNEMLLESISAWGFDAKGMPNQTALEMLEMIQKGATNMVMQQIEMLKNASSQLQEKKRSLGSKILSVFRHDD